MNNEKVGYMDGSDFSHEFGNTTVKVYSTIEELKQEHPCIDECGIVEVKIQVSKWVQPADYSKYHP